MGGRGSADEMTGLKEDVTPTNQSPREKNITSFYLEAINDILVSETRQTRKIVMVRGAGRAFASCG
jgi:hypothetical protein